MGVVFVCHLVHIPCHVGALMAGPTGGGVRFYFMTHCNYFFSGSTWHVKWGGLDQVIMSSPVPSSCQCARNRLAVSTWQLCRQPTRPLGRLPTVTGASQCTETGAYLCA